ncbi:MAG: tetratricopeptide repeat protein [Alphaproteobacteria bacterium]|nr:tetratricopeptide repeat protein [Alphaproteobacteria bacterium]
MRRAILVGALWLASSHVLAQPALLLCLAEADPARRLDYCDAHLRQEPASVKALAARTTAHQALQDVAAAIADYSRAIALDPNNPSLLVERAHLLLDARKFDEAYGDLYDADESDHADPEVYFRLGEGWEKQRQRYYALEAHQRARDLAPGDPKYRRPIADLLRLQCHYDEALAEYDTIIARSVADPEDWNGRGIVHAERKEHDLAIRDFRQAIALSPTTTDCHSNLGDAYRQSGQKDAAMQSLEEALRLDPDNAAAWNNRGRLSLALRDFFRAIEDYDQAAMLLDYKDSGIPRSNQNIAERLTREQAEWRPEFEQGRPLLTSPRTNLHRRGARCR